MKKWIAAAGLLLTQTLSAQTTLVINEELKKSLQEEISKQDFSGTLVVMHRDTVLLELNAGTSSLNGAAFSPAVRSNVCSNGKSMTAVLIQQLLEKGILHADQTMAQLLPQETSLPNAQKITVQHLLTHTSGLGDFFEHPDFEKANPLTTEDFMKLIRTQKPVHDTPGSKFSYSNAGYIVLGAILEKQYHLPYQQIVYQKLLAPLGIDTNKTGYNYATGYYQEGSEWKRGDGNDPARWSAAGGIFLSVTEWNKFMQALITGKLVDTSSLRQLWTRYARPEGNPEFVGYGRGFMIEVPAGLTFIGHNGGIKGFQSAFRYLPQADINIFIFSNHDNGAEHVFMQLLRNLVNQYQSASTP